MKVFLESAFVWLNNFLNLSKKSQTAENKQMTLRILFIFKMLFIKIKRAFSEDLNLARTNHWSVSVDDDSIEVAEKLEHPVVDSSERKRN